MSDHKLIVYGANPWRLADALIAAGCEVRDSDLVPDDRLIVVNPAAFDLWNPGALWPKAPPPDNGQKPER